MKTDAVTILRSLIARLRRAEACHSTDPSCLVFGEIAAIVERTKDDVELALLEGTLAPAECRFCGKPFAPSTGVLFRSVNGGADSTACGPCATRIGLLP